MFLHHQNVYEPPVPEAVVPIDLLEPDLNYEARAAL